MKIRKISCTQFAGVRDREIAFADGVNVVCGENESGKSTMVNLIARTLFQNAKIDNRTDKEFKTLYFPGAVKEGMAGDFADGRIVFETERGTYTLSKEWGPEPRCSLSTPDGVIRDQKKIDKVLKEALVYGEGVYSEMLLTSQRGSDAALQTLLDAGKKSDAKQEIVDVVTRAFAQSSGVSLDALEGKIRERISLIRGAHWDDGLEKPVRNPRGRWVNGQGEILKAYYALEDAQTAMKEGEQLESEVDTEAEELERKEALWQAAERELEEFQAHATALALRNERASRAESLRSQVKAQRETLESWPRMERELEQARALLGEREERRALDRYRQAAELDAAVREVQEKLSERLWPEPREIRAVADAQRKIVGLENKLCGMNLLAKLKLEAGFGIELRSIRTGEEIPVTGGLAAITEAVSLRVPGVLEMELSPADVDVEQVRQAIEGHRAALLAVFDKYGADSLDDLEMLAQERLRLTGELDRARERLDAVLAGEPLEALRSRAPAEAREGPEIDRELTALCGAAPERFAAEREALTGRNRRDYGSVEELKRSTGELAAQLDALTADAGEVPEEYRKVTDPKIYLEMLKRTARERRAEKDAAFAGKSAAEGRLEAYRAGQESDPREAVRAARQRLREQKEDLAHWTHILEVFEQQKAALAGNPMEDIAEAFGRYLGMISGGRVSTEFRSQDRLDMDIYSGSHLVDYGKLSEGTKETVSLAFRLAVLDHLFPEGGGVVVFDDPFSNMDERRRDQACTLVREFAKRQQVIFLTCREEYADLLGGNRIDI